MKIFKKISEMTSYGKYFSSGDAALWGSRREIPTMIEYREQQARVQQNHITELEERIHEALLCLYDERNTLELRIEEAMHVLRDMDETGYEA